MELDTSTSSKNKFLKSLGLVRLGVIVYLGLKRQ